MPLLRTPIDLWRICHLMARTSVPDGGFICIRPIIKEAKPHLLHQGTFVYLILRKPVSGLSPIVLNLCVCVWSFMPWFSNALQTWEDCAFISNICHKYFPSRLPLSLPFYLQRFHSVENIINKPLPLLYLDCKQNGFLHILVKEINPLFTTLEKCVSLRQLVHSEFILVAVMQVV